MILWFQGKVEILEFHEVTIHSATQTFFLPSVMRFKKYLTPRFSIGVRFSRQNVFLRDDHTCQYCNKHFPEKTLTLDHVVPLSKGGGHHWENVVTACSSCNNKKGSMSVEKANLRLLKMPKKPHYLPNRELEWKAQGLPQAWSPYLLPHNLIKAK